jgi:hypothetical protein
MSSPPSAATAPPPAPVSAPSAGRTDYLARLRDPSPVWVFVACLVAGIITVIALDWPPSSDPWAWIDWGQEISSHFAGPRIGLSLTGGPSWKPFPVVFTSIFGFFGGTGPHLWLLVTRTSGLLALVAAYRVARRFGGPVAGVLAALALCLVQDALFFWARGASEPIEVAATLWWIDLHLEGYPRAAYVAGFLAALIRPEFGPFLLLYGIYLWFRVPRSRVLAVALLILVPLAWFGPPAIISGNPFQAGKAALGGQGSPGSAIAELKDGFPLMTGPVIVLAAVGLGLAYLRREMTLVWLGVAAIVWALIEALFTQAAYGLPRYMLPGGAIACVLAGVAVVWLAQEVERRVPGRGAGSRSGRLSPVALLSGAAIVALTLPWTLPRAEAYSTQGAEANQAAHYISRMFTAADLAGGKSRVLPCLDSGIAVNHTLASALAWKLKVPERRVHPSMHGTGFVFSAPHTSTTGTTPPILHLGDRTVRLIVDLPPWKVLEVTHRGASATPRCPPGDRTPA